MQKVKENVTYITHAFFSFIPLLGCTVMIFTHTEVIFIFYYIMNIMKEIHDNRWITIITASLHILLNLCAHFCWIFYKGLQRHMCFLVAIVHILIFKIYLFKHLMPYTLILALYIYIFHICIYCATYFILFRVFKRIQFKCKFMWVTLQAIISFMFIWFVRIAFFS